MAAAALLALSLALGARPALASDCPPDDPSRSDCQAAATTAQNPLVPIAGAALGTIIAVIVNGVLTSRQPLQPPAERPPDKGQQRPAREYTLEVQTQGGRTSLAADGADRIWIFARVRCNQPGVDTSALTLGLAFSAEGPNAGWLEMRNEGLRNGSKAVSVRARPPDAQARLLPGGTSVRCSAAIEGRPVSGAVRLELSEARLEIVVNFEPGAGREYRGVAFERPEEFAADGHDRLTLTAYARQAEQPPEAADPRAEIKLSLLPAGTDFVIETDPDFHEPGKVRATVRAAAPLLYTSGRVRQALRLRVEARLTGPQPPAGQAAGEAVELPAREVALLPRWLYLKLWVVPGARQGTSEVGAFACLAPRGGQALAGLPVELEVQAEGESGPALSLRDPAEQATDRNGLARWTLAYSGLTWENIFRTRFKVKCALRGSDGSRSPAAAASVDVGRNAQAFVQAIDAARAELECDNPYFQSPQWSGLTTALVDRATARALRGPFWNLRCSAVGEGPATENPYVCQKMRDRIYAWMHRRRFGGEAGDPDQTAGMNGIEISQYAISPLHVFAGFHLSGTGPDDDPRMIDPWWKQEWGEALTWREELARTAAVVGPLLVPLTVILGKALAATAAYAAVKAWLLGSWVGYAAMAGGTAVSYGSYRFLVGAYNPEVSADGYYGGARNLLLATAIRWRTQDQAVPFMEPVE